MKRALVYAVAFVLGSCGWLRDDEDARPRRGRERPPAAEVTAKGVGAPRTVVLAVLDTVRADHTSVCGYDRPTTPTLQALVAKGAAKSCRAYSAAPWTHPSHASLFTGKPVTEHAAIWVTDSEVAINPVTRVRPLNDAFVTLAEAFRERGYQTVAVSANMIVTPPSGLLQGFDRIEVTPSSLGFRGKKLRPKLKDVIADLDPTKPLFLFLNLYDAHDPYPPVPDGVGWLPAQDRVDLDPNQHDETHPYFRYVKGLSTDAEAAPFLAKVRDGYDWGVHAADENLGVALELLERAGWGGDDVRLAVTADHGEALGEHRLLRHGGYVVEPMVSVPLLLLDPQGTPPVLPEPVSNVVVHDWLLHGTLPSIPVVASAEKNEQDVLVGRIEGAAWGGTSKAVCRGEQRVRTDLVADPGELHEAPLSADDPLAPTLDAVCQGLVRLHELPVPKQEDPELVRALKELGYKE